MALSFTMQSLKVHFGNNWWDVKLFIQYIRLSCTPNHNDYFKALLIYPDSMYVYTLYYYSYSLQLNFE